MHLEGAVLTGSEARPSSQSAGVLPARGGLILLDFNDSHLR